MLAALLAGVVFIALSSAPSTRRALQSIPTTPTRSPWTRHVRDASASPNMHVGAYALANSLTFNTTYASYPGKTLEFFEASFPVRTRFSQVSYRESEPVSFPADHTAVAIVGYEFGQYATGPDGREEWVPQEEAYNHHYLGLVVGEEEHGWEHSLPASIQSLDMANGGESPFTFHGYPHGYAQVVTRPRRVVAQLMQIDTRPRAGEWTGLPPANQLVECPCTNRVTQLSTRQLLYVHDDNTSTTANVSPELELDGSGTITSIQGFKAPHQCPSETCVGGMGCCRDGWLLAGAEHAIPEDFWEYYVRFRIYFQPFSPDSNAGIQPSHKRLVRLVHTPELKGFNVREVDPALDPIVRRETQWTVESMLRRERVDAADYEWTGGTPPRTRVVGVRLIYANAHCHLGGCISSTLIDAGSGAVLCRQVPVYAPSGYIHSIPPCLWGAGVPGLQSPAELALNATLRASWLVNASRPHFGEMHHWRMRAELIFGPHDT